VFGLRPVASGRYHRLPVPSSTVLLRPVTAALRAASGLRGLLLHPRCTCRFA